MFPTQSALYREGRNIGRALPVVGQLDRRLRLSPQRLRGNKALEVKRLFPREHVIHGARELVSEDREGFGFAVFVFEFREILFPQLVLPSDEDRGFGKGPAQMTVADLFSGGPEPFAIGFLGPLHQATIRHKVLHSWKPRDVLNLI